MGGSLEMSELISIPASYRKNFFETGTYKGETALLASLFFNKVFTIEIDSRLYEYCTNLFSEIKTQKPYLYKGDTLDLIPQIQTKHPTIFNEGVVFFLDAHISGHDSSWNNKNRVPLLEELDLILNGPKLGPSVFIFDDVRMWQNNIWDWVHISNDTILTKIKEKYNIDDHCVKNDRLWVFTK
jgi:hypothetical protein